MNKKNLYEVAEALNYVQKSQNMSRSILTNSELTLETLNAQ